MAYWDPNKQAAEPFDKHLSEALCILLRQGVEKVSAKEVEPDAACRPMLSVLHRLKPVGRVVHRACRTCLTPVVPRVSKTTPASFHLAFVASSDLVQYGSVNCKPES